MTGNENALRKALVSPCPRSLRGALIAAGFSTTSWLIESSILFGSTQHEQQRHLGRFRSQRLACAGSAKFPCGGSLHHGLVPPPAARLEQVLRLWWRAKAQSLPHQIERAPLGFSVNPSDVFPDNAQANKLDSAEEEHGGDNAGPALYPVPGEKARIQGKENSQNGYTRNRKTQPGGQPQRHGRE